MRVLSLSLKIVGVALLMGVFWAVGLGAATGGCVDCAILGGVIVAALSLLGLAFAYLLVTRTSRGRLLIITGRVGLRGGRMLALASVAGVTYGVAAYLLTDSLPHALVAGGAIGPGEFALVPVIIWRLLQPELDVEPSSRHPATDGTGSGGRSRTST